MLKKVIQVYTDTGSDPSSTKQLLNSLGFLSDKFDVIQTNGALLRSSYRLNETALLCFGGGFDLGFLSSLQNAGCTVVRNYIFNGGRYLGLCAGAYFASKRCVFDEHGPLEVVGDRPIGLFPGDAVGPYVPGFQYNSEAGSQAITIIKSSATNTDLGISNAKVYINGGGTFRSQDWTHSDVLYTYENSSDPAIVLSRLGKGLGVISGVHLEYEPDVMNADEHAKLVSSILRTDETSRLQLWKALLKFLLNTENM